MLRLLWIQAGQATGASLLLAGTAGRAPRPRRVGETHRTRTRGRQRSRRERRAGPPADPGRAAGRGLAPVPGQSRARVHHRPRSRRPSCHSRHESGQGPHAGLVVLQIPFFGRTRSLGVRPDRGAIQEGHAERDLLAIDHGPPRHRTNHATFTSDRNCSTSAFIISDLFETSLADWRTCAAAAPVCPAPCDTSSMLLFTSCTPRAAS